MDKLTFALPKKLREAIRKAAALEGRDPSQFVRVVMADRLGIELPAKSPRAKKKVA